MAEATFFHGDYLAIDYTPSAGNVAAGEVVLLGNTAGLTCGIAHKDIVNGELGALAVGDQGVYTVTNLNNAANYAKVWWDNSANKVTTVSTNNALFGAIVDDGGGGANSACRAVHKPMV